MSNPMMAEGVDLSEVEAADGAKWHKILHTDRDVIDRNTGKVLIAAADAPGIAAEMASAFSEQVSVGMVVPVDVNHEITRMGGAGKTFGTTKAVEVRDDGLYAQFEWNDNGKAWIGKDHQGTAQLSPSIRGKLYTTASAEPVAEQFLHSIALTDTPRQQGLGIVTLSESVDLTEIASRAELDRFEQALKLAAVARLRLEGYAIEWSYIANWDGPGDGGTVVISWSIATDDDYADHMRRLEWARTANVITVEGPSVAVERTSEYQVIPESQALPPTSVEMSEPQRQQEKPMPDKKKGLEILLSEMPADDRAVFDLALSEANTATKNAVDALAEVQAKLDGAKLESDATALTLSELSAQLKVVTDKQEAEEAAVKLAARNEFGALLLSEGRVAKGSEGVYLNLFDSDPAAAREMAGHLPKYAHAPKPGATGLSGTNEVELSEDAAADKLSADAKAFQAVELSEGRRVNFRDACDHIKKGAK